MNYTINGNYINNNYETFTNTNTNTNNTTCTNNYECISNFCNSNKLCAPANDCSVNTCPKDSTCTNNICLDSNNITVFRYNGSYAINTNELNGPQLASLLNSNPPLLQMSEFINITNSQLLSIISTSSPLIQDIYLGTLITYLSKTQLSYVAPILSNYQLSYLLNNSISSIISSGLFLYITQSQIANISDSDTIVTLINLFQKILTSDINNPNLFLSYITPSQIRPLSKIQILSIINNSLLSYFSTESQTAILNIIKVNNSVCVTNDDCLSKSCILVDQSKKCMPNNYCSINNKPCFSEGTCLNNSCFDVNNVALFINQAKYGYGVITSNLTASQLASLINTDKPLLEKIEYPNITSSQLTSLFVTPSLIYNQYLGAFIQNLNSTQNLIVGPLLSTIQLSAVLNFLPKLDSITKSSPPHLGDNIKKLLSSIVNNKYKEINVSTLTIFISTLTIIDYTLSVDVLSVLSNIIDVQINSLPNSLLITIVKNPNNLIQYFSPSVQLILNNLIKFNNSVCNTNTDCISNYCSSTKKCMPANDCSVDQCTSGNKCNNYLCTDINGNIQFRNSGSYGLPTKSLSNIELANLLNSDPSLLPLTEYINITNSQLSGLIIPPPVVTTPAAIRPVVTTPAVTTIPVVTTTPVVTTPAGTTPAGTTPASISLSLLKDKYFGSLIKNLSPPQIQFVTSILNNNQLSLILNSTFDISSKIMSSLTQSQVQNITDPNTIILLINIFIRINSNVSNSNVSNSNVSNITYPFISFITSSQIKLLNKSDLIKYFIDQNIIKYVNTSTKITILNVIGINNNPCSNNTDCFSGYCASTNICMSANDCSVDSCPTNSTCTNNYCFDVNENPVFRNNGSYGLLTNNLSNIQLASLLNSDPLLLPDSELPKITDTQIQSLFNPSLVKNQFLMNLINKLSPNQNKVLMPLLTSSQLSSIFNLQKNLTSQNITLLANLTSLQITSITDSTAIFNIINMLLTDNSQPFTLTLMNGITTSQVANITDTTVIANLINKLLIDISQPAAQTLLNGITISQVASIVDDTAIMNLINVLILNISQPAAQYLLNGITPSQISNIKNPTVIDNLVNVFINNISQLIIRNLLNSMTLSQIATITSSTTINNLINKLLTNILEPNARVLLGGITTTQINLLPFTFLSKISSINLRYFSSSVQSIIRPVVVKPPVSPVVTAPVSSVAKSSPIQKLESTSTSTSTSTSFVQFMKDNLVITIICIVLLIIIIIVIIIFASSNSEESSSQTPETPQAPEAPETPQAPQAPEAPEPPTKA